MAFIQRYVTNQTGAITFTGNTLGLSSSNSAGVPGTIDSIGAFITTNTSLKYGSYPAGTTSSYTLNSSSAVLVLPIGSTILYAELIWGGTYVNNGVNLTENINNPINLSTPAGSTSVSPDSATSSNVVLSTSPVSYAYVRSANVTSIVAAAGAGVYAAGGIVGTVAVPDSTTANHAGWTLAVVYQNPALPFRNLSFRVGAELIRSTSGAVNVVVSGFATPTSGTLRGRTMISSQEGDANRTGDQALFGPTTSNLTALSGPNNFANNFFASQINKDDGTLDTSGSFGTVNAINGTPGTNVNGGRQGWDITNVDISSTLINNQTSAILQLTTSGDTYLVNANGIQIDINAPLLSVAKSANVSVSVPGDTITYRITISNTGTASATSAVLTDVIPSGATLVAGSVTVRGTTQSAADPNAGISLGTITAGSSVTVTFQIRVTSLPSPPQLSNQAQVAFSFQSLPSSPVISGSIPSNTVSTPVFLPVLSAVKSASTTAATVGDTVTYTIVVSNSGSISANTVLTDPIPSGSTFVQGSVALNGTVLPSANPAAGVNIGAVTAGGSATLTFQTVVGSIPAGSQLVDQATYTYTYLPTDGRTLSGSGASNTLQIPVSNPSVSVVKSASAIDAVLGDTITYTVSITNSSGASVTNVIVTDPIPSGTSLVAGSVTVDGNPRDANPATGISIASILPGRTVIIAFRVLVGSLPSSAQISNQATASFSTGPSNWFSVSNTVTLPVYQAVLTLTKTTAVTKVTVGDTITYTIRAANPGSITVVPVITDNIPPGAVFVAGSVTLNGISQPSASPAAGIAAGTLAPGSTAVITFQVNVTSLPSPAQIANQANASYSYLLPDGRTLSGASSSNTITLPVGLPNVAIAKSANHTSVTPGDTVVYTITATNSGAATITNAVITDPVPSGSSLVQGSVTVRGSAVPGANPAAGVAVGSLAPGSSITLTFAVNVVSVPASGQLSNTGSISFTSGTFTGTTLSNPVTIPVYLPVISAVKEASVASATVGDTITYSITVSNAGNFNTNVTVTDPIPSGAVFVTNSVTLNGTPQPGTDPQTGIMIGTVSSGSSSVVTFQAVITSLPAPPTLTNQAAAAASFTLPDGRIFSSFTASNKVSVAAAAPNIGVIKSTGAADAIVGDILTYTVSVTNRDASGTVGSVVVNDPIPAGTEFVSGSVTVNGIVIPSANPVTGIPVGSLAAGASAAVTFQLKVTGEPFVTTITNQATVSYTNGAFQGSTVSNSVSLNVYQPVITISQTSSQAKATVGDILTYTLNTRNDGNIAVKAVVTDPIPAGSTLLVNSVTLNGFPLPGADPASGIQAGLIAPGGAATITFQVVIPTMPTPPLLLDQATVNYTFQPPDGRTVPGSSLSNTVSIPVSSPNVTVLKSASAQDAVVGDTVTYTVTITNNGIENVTNVILTDIVSAEASFVPGSTVINGTSSPSSPVSGIPIGTLAPGAPATVSFQVVVNSLPAAAVLNDQATVSFTSGTLSFSSVSNTVATPVYQPIISLVKSVNSVNATLGDTVTYTVQAHNSGNLAAMITIVDIIPSSSSLVPNSVTVNGSPAAGANPASGISIGTLAPGGNATVTFQTVVNSIPGDSTLRDEATAFFTYQPPDGRTLNGSAQSNSVAIPVSAPNVTVTQTTSDPDASVGDIITYTVTAVNNGIENVAATVITDPIPSGAAFIVNSVTVNGISVPGANPSVGVPVGVIPPGGTSVLTFQVQVSSLPTPAQLANQATVAYTSGSFTGSSVSNQTVLPVYQPLITLTKSSSLARTTVGDTLAYMLSVSNTGNYPAQVFLSDPIPPGSQFIENSVIIGGTSVPGANPAIGFYLGTISPNSTLELSFTVTVTSVPAEANLVNQAAASFTFIPPDGAVREGSSLSPVVSVPVSAPNVSVMKSADLTNAAFGDVVTYTIQAANTGFENVTNVILTDPIPEGATYVTGSVTIDGVPSPAANPVQGISIPLIAPGATVTVQFKVTTTSIPVSGSLSNLATVSFNSGAFTGSSFSNEVNIPVSQPILNVTLASSTANATVGDTVIYTFTVNNSGNTPASAVLTSPIPAGAAFVPNSVVINGQSSAGADPSSGINTGTVPAGGSITVSYQVVVSSVPSPPYLDNQGTATYTFLLPDGRTLTGSVVSPLLSTPVSAPNVTVVKSTSAQDAVVGDSITYTLNITNAGIEQVTNIVITDLPGTGSEFVLGSVLIDGIVSPGSSPINGILVSTLAPGASVIVSFIFRVISLPSPAVLVNQAAVGYTSGALPFRSLSNQTTVPVYQAILSLTKTANKTTAQVGTGILYTITAQNTGNVPAMATIFDNIPAGSTLIENSLLVNGTPVPGASPVQGILVGPINPGGSVTITFQTEVTSVPSPPVLTDQATSTYTFSPPDGRTITGSAASGPVSVTTSAPNINVVKSAGAADAVVGDKVTYTVLLTNNGTDTVTDLLITDPAPAGSAFVPGSVTLGGSPLPGASPIEGIPADSLAPGASLAVTFQFAVNALPAPPQLLNQAAVTYTSGAFTGTSYSDNVTVPVYQPIITVTKQAGAQKVSVGDTLGYTLTVTNTGNLAASVTLSDNIPAGSQFIENSVLVNGIPTPGANPAAGVSVGIIQPGASGILAFQTVVISLPSPQFLSDQASAQFSFQPPDGRTLTGNAVSPVLSIPVSSPDVSIVKGVTSTTAVVGDVLTYTIALTNNGISQVANVVVSDPIPAGSVFIEGSVTVGGAARAGVSPVLGIPISSIAAGATVLVTFQVRVTSLPGNYILANQAAASFTSGAFSGSSVSNTVTVQIYQPILTAAKTSSISNATVGDLVTYKIVVSNTGNIAASTVVSDPIPTGSTLVPNSVLVNGIPQPGLNPQSGVPTAPIGPGQSVTVQFQVLVTSIPPSSLLVDQALASFQFALPDGRTPSGELLSNTVEVAVPSVDASLTKQASASFAVLGDRITYTLFVSNKDPDNLAEAVVQDLLPEGTKTVPSSVIINGISVPGADPETGLHLGTLESGDRTEIIFQADVVSIPASLQLSNQASLSFQEDEALSTVFSNTVSMPLYQPIISITQQASVPIAAPGDQVTYTLTVLNSGNIGAFVLLMNLLPEGTSFVPNSLTINGALQAGASMASEVVLGTLYPGDQALVTYQVVVLNRHAVGSITSQAQAAFSFQLPDGRQITQNAYSEPIEVEVLNSRVTAVLQTPLTEAIPGERIPWSISLANQAGSQAANIAISGFIPPGATLVKGTFAVDGVVVADPNVFGEVQIASVIEPGQTVLIQYDTVQGNPEAAFLIKNQPVIHYTMDSDRLELLTNLVTLPLFSPNLNVTKQTSAEFIRSGQPLTYTINIVNQGNVRAEIVLKDALPEGLVFEQESLTIGGAASSLTDLSLGIPIGSLWPDTSAVVVFQARLSDQNTAGIINNTAEAVISFALPSGRVITSVQASNTSRVPVVSPLLSVAKSADRQFALLGDLISYTITITNVGGVPAENLLLTDTLPDGLAFKPGSVTVSGNAQFSSALNAGISIATLWPGQNTAVTFQVEAVSIPQEAVQSNQAVVSYTVRLDDGAILSESAVSTISTIILRDARPVIVLAASAHEVEEYNLLALTVVITNQGNVVMEDLLLTGPFAAVNPIFLKTAALNGRSLPSPNLAAGIPLGSLPAGGELTVSLLFEVESLTTSSFFVAQVGVRYRFERGDQQYVERNDLSNSEMIRLISDSGTEE
ncbi:DUF11 domain-containing protein [Paenibacillus sp. J22TS3]|uniref:DUF7507 domain-containing protein n=1 Tax=Paenibacillus sp. J22TS3 TaxID=2807192 RepID=UPI001B0956E8|nr:DUF11 domain-containing protein [Paenibacillus sp. J22TS3]GIP23952.1 cell surface protein [Paenibacillus sp. J22TS3]